MINPCENCSCKDRCEYRTNYMLYNSIEIIKEEFTNVKLAKFFRIPRYLPKIKCYRFSFGKGTSFYDCDEKMISEMLEDAAKNYCQGKLETTLRDASQAMKNIYYMRKISQNDLLNFTYKFDSVADRTYSFDEFSAALLYEASERCFSEILKGESK